MFGLQKHIDKRNQQELERELRQQENPFFENSNSGLNLKKTAIRAAVAGVVGYQVGKKIGSW